MSGELPNPYPVYPPIEVRCPECRAVNGKLFAPRSEGGGELQIEVAGSAHVPDGECDCGRRRSLLSPHTHYRVNDAPGEPRVTLRPRSLAGVWFTCRKRRCRHAFSVAGVVARALRDRPRRKPLQNARPPT